MKFHLSTTLTESLIHWGEALGTIKKGEVSIANFDDTLKDKWVTTQVMEKAFGEFADFTLKVKEAIDSGEYDTASDFSIYEITFSSQAISMSLHNKI